MFKKITNPFGDESSDEDDVTNPFARKKPARKIPGDDSSDDESDAKSNNNNNNNNNHKTISSNFTNPFGKKKSPTSAPVSSPPAAAKNSNPFDSPTKPKTAGAGAGAGNNSSNPFDDDTSVPIKPIVAKTTSQPEQALKKNIASYNPFGGGGGGGGGKDSHSNNPFGDDVDSQKDSVPKPLVSQKPSGVERNKTVQTSNRLNYSSSIADKTNNNNNNTGRKKGFFNTRNTGAKTHERSLTQPILPSMDQDDSNSILPGGKASAPTANNHQNRHRRNVTSAGMDMNFKQSTSTLGSTSLTSWLSNASSNNSSNSTGANNTASESKQQESAPTTKSIFATPQRKLGNNTNSTTSNVTFKPNEAVTTPTPKRKSPKKKKRNHIVQCWKYDNYDIEQKEYYTHLQERDSFYGPNSPSQSVIITPNSVKRKKNRVKKKKKEAEAGGGYYSDGESNDIPKPNGMVRSKSIGGGDNQLFERPQDLPSIKEAVQNLSLFDFENKAEERAVVIVSTWLFDAGLIDELLANGGSGGVTSPRNAPNMMDQTISSVKSSEGIEVGVHGFPLEGGLKIDKEIEKLRASSQRELTLINTRLNDGVAASGAEVQEMVNAVSATRMDLGRLRELVTYISSGYKKDGFDSNFNSNHSSEEGKGDNEGVKLILSDFPRLKRAINARRNIFRCFRELEFFSQIPLTCDTLREELHAGEWTDNEFNTIRNVCMEHVKLEILLVEAEAGMKTWLDDEDLDDESSMPSLRSNKSLRKSWKGKQALMAGHYDVVDNFLSQHVKNVWELGDEIRMRILSGIGSAFDLALNNPQGMVALVEAVEVYEHAAEQYKASHENGEDESTNSTRNRLHFTNMRAAALAQLYEDFELRGLEVFRAIHMQAADVANEEDALNSQFSAVMRAATELVTEIDVVKNQMAPCFAPHWRVEMLWSACVAHVTSNQIIQQIGGPEGQSLPELTVTQLLDLVAWVEFFRETIEDAFPDIGEMHSKKTYFDEKPNLFAGDDKAVNMENATDILAWTNNMLWDVHRLAQDEFLLRTRSQTDDLLTKVYSANHETYQTSEMRLISSLCEDVFSLVGVHLRTIRERLTRKSDALVMAVCLIFSQLRAKQISSRDRFLKDLDTCCAAANDFQRMSEQVEDVLQDLVDQCEFSEKSSATLEESCNALVSLYSGDAVYAAQKAHSFIFEPIYQEITEELFSIKWETEFTHNELALKLTRTLDDYMADLETFLDEFMLKKTVDALVAATVVFYVKSLLLKAENHNSNKRPYFSNPSIALERMEKDVKVFKGYFDGLAEGMPALSKVIEKEFHVLTTVLEMIRIVLGISDMEASDFILVLHKRLKDVNITKYVVGDIWHLVKPTEERTIWELIESLEPNLIAVCPPDNSKIANDRMNVPGLRLDETLAKHYIQSKRKRPVVAGAVEKMVTTMKNNWTNPDESGDQ